MCQMPNIWHIWHIKLQNMSFIMCFICAIFLKHATVRSSIWERTVYLYHNLYYFFILTGPTSSISSSPLSSLCLLIPSSNCICSLSLYSSSLPPSPMKLRPEHQATLPHMNSTYTLRSPSTNTATRTRPTTSTTTHGLIITPRHTAEHVVPSTTSSEPPTIGFLSIGLQWWVLLLGLFDLGCGCVWFGCVFCHVDLSSFFFLFFFIFFYFYFLRWRWWMWVCAGGGCRCCCGSGGCAVVVVDDDEDDRE